MKNSIADKIFDTAENFHKSYELLNQQKEKEIFLTPAVVQGALALELYFKSLFVYSTGKIIKGHEIDKIFEQLDSTIKKSLTDGFNVFISTKENQECLEKMKDTTKMKLPSNFMDCLKEAGQVFVKARYIYEGKKWSFFFYEKIRELVILEIEKL